MKSNQTGWICLFACICACCCVLGIDQGRICVDFKQSVWLILAHPGSSRDLSHVCPLTAPFFFQLPGGQGRATHGHLTVGRLPLQYSVPPLLSVPSRLPASRFSLPRLRVLHSFFLSADPQQSANGRSLFLAFWRHRPTQRQGPRHAPPDPRNGIALIHISCLRHGARRLAVVIAAQPIVLLLVVDLRTAAVNFKGHSARRGPKGCKVKDEAYWRLVRLSKVQGSLFFLAFSMLRV
jgi:hypothetical protein